MTEKLEASWDSDPGSQSPELFLVTFTSISLDYRNQRHPPQRGSQDPTWRNPARDGAEFGVGCVLHF